MEIYVEYALAENFFLDAMLLWLALRTAKQKISPGRLVLASAVGAAFAVVFPLLQLGTVFSYILRFAVGFLLCLIAVKGKGWGRYAITSLLFFGYSFGLGGALLALYSAFSLPAGPCQRWHRECSPFFRTFNAFDSPTFVDKSVGNVYHGSVTINVRIQEGSLCAK